MRVVVFDDDPELQQVVNLVLEQEGHEVVAMHNAVGADTAAAVVALEPDVVLSDVRMPGDGYHLTDDLVGRHHPPIVLMSAWIIGVEEVRRHGAADLLQKPFDLEELLDRLSSAAAAGWKRPLKLQDAAEEAQEEQRTG